MQISGVRGPKERNNSQGRKYPREQEEGKLPCLRSDKLPRDETLSWGLDKGFKERRGKKGMFQTGREEQR